MTSKKQLISQYKAARKHWLKVSDKFAKKKYSKNEKIKSWERMNRLKDQINTMESVGLCEICGDLAPLEDGVCSKCQVKYPLM